MRTHTVPGFLIVALLLCGCATRLPLGHDESALPVSGTSSDALRGQATPALLRAESPAPHSICYQRVAEELRAAPGACWSPCEREEIEHHKLNVFLGYTGERGGGGATVGLDYEWRISELVGVEVFADHVFGDVVAYAFGALVAFHPWKGLVVVAGPGVDFDVDEGEMGATELEADFLFRIGVAYEFELGKGWSIGPGFLWDIIVPKDSAWIVGLNIGKAW